LVALQEEEALRSYSLPLPLLLLLSPPSQPCEDSVKTSTYKLGREASAEHDLDLRLPLSRTVRK
jgi:hypothetical protein